MLFRFDWFCGLVLEKVIIKVLHRQLKLEAELCMSKVNEVPIILKCGFSSCLSLHMVTLQLLQTYYYVVQLGLLKRGGVKISNLNPSFGFLGERV